MVAVDRPESYSPSRISRVSHVDGMRGLAALYVLLHHAFLTVWPMSADAPPNVMIAPFVGWLAYGHFAVVVFIVLSGYCLTIPVLAKGPDSPVQFLGFMKRRAVRIIPPYYAALVLSVVLDFTLLSHKTGSHWDMCIPVTGETIGMHALLLQDVWWTGTPNHVFWSIAVEWHIYALFPAIVCASRKFGVIAACAVGVVVAYTVAIVSQGQPWQGITAHFVGLFCLGMLAAHGCAPRPGKPTVLLERLPWGLLAATIVMVVFVVCNTIGIRQIAPSLYWLDGLVGSATLCMLLSFQRQPGKAVPSLLSSPYVVSLGAISYSLYLTHAPIVQLIWQCVLKPLSLNPESTFIALLILALPACIAIAAVFYIAFERPSVGWARRYKT